MIKSIKNAIILFGVLLVFSFIVIAVILRNYNSEENILEPTWSIGIYEGKTPFDLKAPLKNVNPVQHPIHLPSGEASLLAHPRMIIKDSRFYLFYTAVNRLTDKRYKIALAESGNGYDWEFKKLVMDGSYNLAHPFVFEFENQIFMIPEPAGGSTVPLYIAEEFPYKWKYEKDLVTMDNLVSPFVFRHNHSWWMIHSQKGNEMMYLYFADDLYGPWKEHPQSPVIIKNKQAARPAGKPFEYNGILYRLAINCIPVYGSGVLAFRVDELTRTSFSETRVEQPFVEGGKSGWNSLMMHHADVHHLGQDHWIAVVDGKGISN